MSTSLFHQYFSDIDDPRQLGKIDHKLFDILFLTITAVIAARQRVAAMSTDYLEKVIGL